MTTLEQAYWQTVNAQRALLGLPPINAAATQVAQMVRASGKSADAEDTEGRGFESRSACAATPDNQPVQRDSSLWNRLAIQTDDCGDGSRYCSECGYETERYDVEDGDGVCADCAAELVRGQERDKFLDNPQRGQAADINRGRF